MTTTPKHRLRWYQYSLRSLFVLTVLVAIAGSWFAVKKQEKERERAAVRAIEDEGGAVQYDWEYDAVDKEIRLAVPPGPAWLRAWLGDDFFARVSDVGLGKEATDAGLERLKGMTQLKGLCLNHTQVTDAGLERLKGMTQLEVLLLDHTKITDAGLEHLKGLSQLRSVNFAETNVTNEGCQKLQEALPNCEIVR